MSKFLKTCIKNKNKRCIDRDSPEFVISGLKRQCCHDEILEEIAIAQTVVDAIDDCSKNYGSLLKVSSSLSYAANVINKNNEDNLMEVLPVVQRFSLLMYEYKEKILSDLTVSELVFSFTHELQKWFAYSFLAQQTNFNIDSQRKSIISDINTIEMALGSCIIVNENTEPLDDFFF